MKQRTHTLLTILGCGVCAGIVLALSLCPVMAQSHCTEEHIRELSTGYQECVDTVSGCENEVELRQECSAIWCSSCGQNPSNCDPGCYGSALAWLPAVSAEIGESFEAVVESAAYGDTAWHIERALPAGACDSEQECRRRLKTLCEGSRGSGGGYTGVGENVTVVQHVDGGGSCSGPCQGDWCGGENQPQCGTAIVVCRPSTDIHASHNVISETPWLSLTPPPFIRPCKNLVDEPRPIGVVQCFEYRDENIVVLTVQQ